MTVESFLETAQDVFARADERADELYEMFSNGKLQVAQRAIPITGRAAYTEKLTKFLAEFKWSRDAISTQFPWIADIATIPAEDAEYRIAEALHAQSASGRDFKECAAWAKNQVAAQLCNHRCIEFLELELSRSAPKSA